MSEVKFTKGPWVADIRGGCCAVYPIDKSGDTSATQSIKIRMERGPTPTLSPPRLRCMTLLRMLLICYFKATKANAGSMAKK